MACNFALSLFNSAVVGLVDNSACTLFNDICNLLIVLSLSATIAVCLAFVESSKDYIIIIITNT